MQSLLDSGFSVADSYKLEAIFSNDENSIPRTKEDQEFINQCHKELVSKIKG
jgi:hypothetical protein